MASLAQQTANEFNHSNVTVAVPTIAKRYGATKEQLFTGTKYEFPDGSTLTVTGRGKAHRMVVEDE